MKQKDVKALIVPMSSVIALSVGAFLGLDNVTEIKDALIALGTGAVAAAAAFGVWRNNDKGDK